jgi:hypothetical protein
MADEQQVQENVEYRKLNFLWDDSTLYIQFLELTEQGYAIAYTLPVSRKEAQRLAQQIIMYANTRLKGDKESAKLANPTPLPQ